MRPLCRTRRVGRVVCIDANSIADVTLNLPEHIAARVRSCPIFRDAVTLATSGVPKPDRTWTFATGAGLAGSETAGTKAAGNEAAGSGGAGSGSDAEILERWLAGVRAVLAAETADGEDDGALLLALSVLGVLARRESEGPFWEAVRVTLQGLCDRTASRFPFRTRRQYTDHRWNSELPGLIALLTELGMVTEGISDTEGTGINEGTGITEGAGAHAGSDAGPVPEMTELGRWACDPLAAGLPVPADPGLRPDDLVTKVLEFSDDHARDRVASGWLDGRDPAEAARELLTAADSMAPSRRVVAIWITRGIGAGALPAWRDMTTAPNTGPYARMMLREECELPCPAEMDIWWLAVEDAAVALESGDPDEALSLLWEASPADTLDATLAAIPAAGHPEADLVAKLVAEFIASGAPRSVEQALQLTVTLQQDGTRRAVQVPAIFTLADLHDVIQALHGHDAQEGDGAQDSDGERAYMFRVGTKAYTGASHHVEGTGYDGEIRLAGALTQAETITYARAGRDCDITLEKKLAQDPRTAYPCCVAFDGGNPAGEAGLDEVNRRLSGADTVAGGR